MKFKFMFLVMIFLLFALTKAELKNKHKYIVFFICKKQEFNFNNNDKILILPVDKKYKYIYIQKWLYFKQKQISKVYLHYCLYNKKFLKIFLYYPKIKFFVLCKNLYLVENLKRISNISFIYFDDELLNFICKSKLKYNEILYKFLKKKDKDIENISFKLFLCNLYPKYVNYINKWGKYCIIRY